MHDPMRCFLDNSASLEEACYFLLALKMEGCRHRLLEALLSSYCVSNTNALERGERSLELMLLCEPLYRAVPECFSYVRP